MRKQPSLYERRRAERARKRAEFEARPKPWRMVYSDNPTVPPTCVLGSTSFWMFENNVQVERWVGAYDEWPDC